MKDERNHHGAVDKYFSEQRICIVDDNYILCEKDWTCTHSGTGSYGRQAGRQVADEIQVNLEFFKNHCTSKDLTFCFVLTKVQQHYSSRNAFHVFFGAKSIVKLVF